MTSPPNVNADTRRSDTEAASPGQQDALRELLDSECFLEPIRDLLAERFRKEKPELNDWLSSYFNQLDALSSNLKEQTKRHEQALSHADTEMRFTLQALELQVERHKEVLAEVDALRAEVQACVQQTLELGQTVVRLTRDLAEERAAAEQQGRQSLTDAAARRTASFVLTFVPTLPTCMTREAMSAFFDGVDLDNLVGVHHQPASAALVASRLVDFDQLADPIQTSIVEKCQCAQRHFRQPYAPEFKRWLAERARAK